jgi:type I restriction enzyme S subunit
MTRWIKIRLGDMLTRSTKAVIPQDTSIYKLVTVKMHNKGVVLRQEVNGSKIKSTRMFCVQSRQFILSRIDARNGAFGIIPPDLDGALVTNDFPIFNIDKSRIDLNFLKWKVKTQDFIDICKRASEGTTNRVRLKENRFADLTISLPPLPEQCRMVAKIEKLTTKIEEAKKLRKKVVKETQLLIVSARYNLIFPEKAYNWKTLLFDKAVDKLRGPNVGLPKKEYKSSGEFPVIDQGKGYIGGYTNDESRVFRVAAPVIVWGDHTTNSKLVDFDFVPGADGTKIFSPKEELLAGYVNQFLKTVNYPEMGYSRHYRHLKKQQIPVPPLSEQRRIIAYLDSLQAKIDNLKLLQHETQSELDVLIPSILAKAFRGEL